MAPPAAGAAGKSALAKLPLPAKLGVGVGFVALIAFAYWFIFYADVSKKIDAANVQSKTLKTELLAQQQAQASYFADRDELALRQQRAREFNKVLPAEKQQPQFLSAVQQAAGTAGVNLVVYQPMDEQRRLPILQLIDRLIGQCFTDARERFTEPQRVTVTFNTTLAGGFESVGVGRGSWQDPQLTACILDSLEEARFESPGYALRRQAHTFTFSPADAGD